jgi:hypothetical protein
MNYLIPGGVFRYKSTNHTTSYVTYMAYDIYTRRGESKFYAIESHQCSPDTGIRGEH